MKIGNLIRKCRKEKKLTQEELANYLGVSAAAVNKWENDNSYPDITLLAPIARLLEITLDELLSFQENLSVEEVYEYIEKLNQMLKQDQFVEAYEWSKEKIKEFPSCYPLMVRVAVVLDANRLLKVRELPEGFEKFIESLFQRALASSDESVRLIAVDSLIGYYIRQKKYQEAESYLEYYSPQNPEKKRKQAQLYYETGQDEKAYKSYEELLYSEFLKVSALLQGIYMLAVRNKQFDKAHRIVDKQTELAKLFDMGRYYEVSCHLELAAIEKDELATIKIMKETLESIDNVFAAKESNLYEHMTFKEIDLSFYQELRDNLRKSYADEETFGYMKNNSEWKNLLEKD